MTRMTLGRELKALNVMNISRRWVILMTQGHDLKALNANNVMDNMNNSRL